MASETIITWSAPNWITVVVMAAGGFVAIGLVLRLFAGWRNRTRADA